MEGSDLGGGERTQVEGRVRRSDLGKKGAIAGGRERSQVEGSDLRWRGAIRGGGERSQVEGRVGTWRRVISDRGERSQRPGLTAGAAALLHSPLPGRGRGSHR